MIVLGETIEPKASKANSIYPAIITAVYNDSNNVISVPLSFYCPSIMSGEPRNAGSSATTNFVDAPKKKDDNNDYSYQRGDLIMISFADGNLNSPQFVRYVYIDDNTRNHNIEALENKIVQEDYIDFNDDISTVADIETRYKLRNLNKVLEAIQICARGKTNAKGIIESNGSYVHTDTSELIYRYRKCGPYGTEFLFRKPNYGFSLEALFENTNKPSLIDLYNDSPLQNNAITFLSFCNRIMTQDVNVDEGVLVDIFTNSIASLNNSAYVQLDKNDEKDILNICKSLAGFKKWEEGAPRIKAGVEKPSYLQFNNPDALTGNLLFLDYYLKVLSGSYTTITNNDNTFLTEFWNSLYNENNYKNEFDRMYAIIFFNNLIRNELSNSFSLLNILNSVIATAYPLIEYCLFVNYSKLSEETITFLETFRSWLTDDSKYNNTSFILQNKTYIAENIDKLITEILLEKREDEEAAFSDTYQAAKNNIELVIDFIVNNNQTFLNIHQSTTPTNDTTNSNHAGSYSSYKSYMYYTSITAKNSQQYILQHNGRVINDSETGVRVVNEDNKQYYCIAIGSGWGFNIGDKIYVKLSNNNGFYAIMGDQKADIHTDSNNIVDINNGSVVEMIVGDNFGSASEQSSLAKKMGDCNYINKFKGNVLDIVSAANVNNSNNPNVEWLWPVPESRRITQAYKENSHKAIDIGAQPQGHNGNAIVATKDGKVMRVYNWNGVVTQGDTNSYGNLVVIKHSDGKCSYYAHLQSINVSEDANVVQGQVIGFMDSTGNSSASHLHFEIRDSFGGNRLNPCIYLGIENAKTENLILPY